MRKIIVPIVLFLCISGAALSDTLYLKNGSTLQGTFVTFENGEFVFDATDGNRVNIAANRVSRLVIDRDAFPRAYRRDGYSRDSSGGNWENAALVDVSLQEQWIRSQIQVYKGQRVRVEASGTLTIGGWATIGPDGLGGQRDPNAPMSNENDGALIAALGQDFDAPLVLIGRSREFVADRDGMLFFMVNHQGTANSRGAFRVNVSVDRSTGGSAIASTYQTQGREKTITVSAGQAWTDTGIDLEPNTTADIVAEGKVTIGKNRRTGPDSDLGTNVSTSTYPISSKGVGAVIAKIRRRSGRDSSIVFIGSHGQLSTQSNEYGRLFIGINDDAFGDNSVDFRVTIRW